MAKNNSGKAHATFPPPEAAAFQGVVTQNLPIVSKNSLHNQFVYLIVIGNDAEVKPSAVAVIVTVPGLFLAPIIARAKPLNALR